jgi:hypothetical protein
MLSEKPWKPEAVLLLGSGLMLSLFAGMSLGLLLDYLLPGLPQADRKFYSFLISTVSFQGVGLVLIHHFLKLHGVRWRDQLGLLGPRRAQAFAWALATVTLALPLALLLSRLSAQFITSLRMEPQEQHTLKVLQVSVGLGQRICFGLAAIVLAPIVEEILFRGILYPVVKQRGHPALALAGTSLLFAAIHYNLMTFVPLTFLAVALTWVYEKTDNLLAPIATHCIFNATNFFLFIYEPEVNRWWHELARWWHERI